MSLIVVMNGPDAIAGSNFNLLMSNGKTAPITAEMLKVNIIEIPTIRPSIQFW